jgi:DnaK suppressor protein
MAKLSEDQVAQIKAALQKRYIELRQEIQGELENSGEQQYVDLAGSVADVGDHSVADMLLDLNAAFVDRQVNEIREVEAALRRVAELNFGDCVDCGNEIGFERLKVHPTARRCVLCQGLYEKTHAHEPYPTL